MMLVLAGAGLFVYVRLKANLDESLDVGLRARSAALATLANRAGTPLAGGEPAEAEENFAQVLAVDGRVLDATSGMRRPVLTVDEVRRAMRKPVVVEGRSVPVVEGPARILARRVSGRSSSSVLAVGQSLDDRDEALAGVVKSFGIGGPLAIVLASLIGYALASAGLSPVEAMRRRAAEVSLREDERLPLPAAHDEVRRLGETLNDMLDRLRRSFERERRFVADASHELRTPVAVVKTELEGALRTGDYGPQVREALVAAVEECDHLAHLAEDLLVIARSADGRLPVLPEPIAVRSELEGVRERFSDRARQHRRAIRVDAPADLRVSADVLRLRQALANLVDNALRHGEGDVVLSSRRASEGVELDVSDRGNGFAPDIAERAFERFTRGDLARTRTHGGAGLGMSIVQAVAEAHGGWAAIVPGSGTTVRVWLPNGGPPSHGHLS
jgi:signal transduction histidine kinase